MNNNKALVNDVRLSIHEASLIATERSMSNQRLISTVVAVLLGLFLAYTSFFYFPAYQSKSSVLDVATEQGSVPEPRKVKLVGLEPYLEQFMLQRGYMKAGQTVSLSYKVSEGTQLKLLVSKCAGPVIIEVYSCRGSIVDSVDIGSRLDGVIDLTVQSNGFYHFTEQLLESSAKNNDFELVWKRL